MPHVYVLSTLFQKNTGANQEGRSVLLSNILHTRAVGVAFEDGMQAEQGSQTGGFHRDHKQNMLSLCFVSNFEADGNSVAVGRTPTGQQKRCQDLIACQVPSHKLHPGWTRSMKILV